MDEQFEGRARRRIPTIGQLVSEGVGDLGQLVRLVPEIASALRSIQKHVKSMDFEVIGMHASVERLEVEIRELRTEIRELDGRMGTVADAVTRLEPHIQDVNLAVRPFRRARSRLGGSRPLEDQSQVSDGPMPAGEAAAAAE
jgi:uncharacterized protein YoxC